ncbi:MAG TPA: terminase TerL endonuclease subunit [Rhodocyclaceae bacterium]|jgi:phage terminase large subunit-like protein
MTATPLTFADRATNYARAVVEGQIVACKWHKLACQRHLNDLARSVLGDWPYVWNPELTDATGKQYYPAERICRFVENLPHIKGDWAGRGQLIELEDWQVFILASIFGWINKVTLKRRFRVADVIVPRKNAKSTLAAGIGLYMLGVDGEFGAEVYSGATSQDQAMEVFRPAALMARATPMYRQKYGVAVNASNLSITENNSKMEPVIGKPGDGASPSCSIVDEYHEHKTTELYDTMATGMGARSQPLMLVITTSGSNISGPCYMHQKELEKVLEGMIENDQRFGIVFTIDEDDDWTSEDALKKANPNYGISVDADFLKTQQRDAQADPRKQNVFKTKHLNIWVAAASPWLNLFHLQKGSDPALSLDDFRGESCVIGLDLASKQDIASAVWEFKRNIDGHDHYYAISRNFIPEAALEKPENGHYQAWVHTGHLVATPGNMIALAQIEEEILASAEIVHIAEVAKDPYGGQQMGSNLQEQGLEVVDIPQNVRYLSEPMKDIQALVDAGRFHHDGNPCYIWQLSNVECKPDRNENIFPRKLMPQNKIDAAVATIVAHNRAMVGGDGDIITADYELMVI